MVFTAAVHFSSIEEAQCRQTVPASILERLDE